MGACRQMQKKFNCFLFNLIIIGVLLFTSPVVSKTVDGKRTTEIDGEPHSLVTARWTTRQIGCATSGKQEHPLWRQFKNCQSPEYLTGARVVTSGASVWGSRAWRRELQDYTLEFSVGVGPMLWTSSPVFRNRVVYILAFDSVQFDRHKRIIENEDCVGRTICQFAYTGQIKQFSVADKKFSVLIVSDIIHVKTTSMAEAAFSSALSVTDLLRLVQ